ncbi:MAG: GNAT family N-acetyltransferase [Chitinophagales bacterium]|nr:GNAT family N-acetyltransferase [Chitinophagales bacterium]
MYGPPDRKALIRYLSHSEIDKERWDACIAGSLNALPYAYSHYLDVVTGNCWDALVLDEYAAVFPLPVRKKWGFRAVFQPFFCQQLGLFVTDAAQYDLLPEFLRAIPKRFIRVYVQLNTRNSMPAADHRVTYQIPLQRDYASIAEQYGTIVRKNMKRIGNMELTHESSPDVPTFLRFLKENLGDKLSDLGPNDMHMLQALLQMLLERKEGFIRYALDESGQRQGAVFLVHSHGMLIYLLAAHTPAGKKKSVMTYLIDSVLQEYAEKEKLFDFEGSMIPGIANFYSNFGAREVKFPVYKNGII